MGENYFAENLRFRIWNNKKRTRPPAFQKYADSVAQRCSITSHRMSDLLWGEETPADEERGAILAYFEKYGQDLPLDEPLWNTLPQGEQKELAIKNLIAHVKKLTPAETRAYCLDIGINLSTVARWKEGLYKPAKYAQEQSARHFGYQDVEAMARSFVFLELNPPGIIQRKAQCKQLIDALPEERFLKLYDCLKIILE